MSASILFFQTLYIQHLKHSLKNLFEIWLKIDDDTVIEVLLTCSYQKGSEGRIRDVDVTINGLIMTLMTFFNCKCFFCLAVHYCTVTYSVPRVSFVGIIQRDDILNSFVKFYPKVQSSCADSINCQ